MSAQPIKRSQYSLTFILSGMLQTIVSLSKPSRLLLRVSDSAVMAKNNEIKPNILLNKTLYQAFPRVAYTQNVVVAVSNDNNYGKKNVG